MISATENRQVVEFSPENREDFFELHSAKNDAGWCFCSAWWVESWDGFGGRSAEQNCRLRENLLDRGEYDGYLLYVNDRPVGWCQVGLRDRLTKLVRQFKRPPDPQVYAITCFFVAPDFRRQGCAETLLVGVIDRLKRRGVKTVEAYPHRGEHDAEDLWTGPESLFARYGFRVLDDDPRRPVMVLEIRK